MVLCPCSYPIPVPVPVPVPVRFGVGAGIGVPVPVHVGGFGAVTVLLDTQRCPFWWSQVWVPVSVAAGRKSHTELHIRRAPYNGHVANICMSDGAVLSLCSKAMARSMRTPLHKVSAIPKRAQKNFPSGLVSCEHFRPVRRIMHGRHQGGHPELVFDTMLTCRTLEISWRRRTFTLLGGIWRGSNLLVRR